LTLTFFSCFNLWWSKKYCKTSWTVVQWRKHGTEKTDKKGNGNEEVKKVRLVDNKETYIKKSSFYKKDTEHGHKLY